MERSVELVNSPTQATTTLSFQKLEGLIALERSKVKTEDSICTGDFISLFHCPDGSFILTKQDSPINAVKIGRITPAYIYLDEQVNVIEK